MAEEKVFQKGETVTVWAYIKNWAGTFIDPSSGVKITITNPSGTVKVTAQSMTKSEVGKYAYYYNSATDDVSGWWKVSTLAQDGSGETAKITITNSGFTLQ
jgi:hypothetical protein